MMSRGIDFLVSKSINLTFMFMFLDGTSEKLNQLVIAKGLTTPFTTSRCLIAYIFPMAVNLRKQDFESDTWRLKSTQDLCKLQLMKKTGAIKWLQWAGIPYTIARREQDSGIRLEDKNNDVLDSATCMESLDTISYHFEWEFYENETWMIEGSEPLWIGYGGLEGYGPIRGHLSRLFHWQLSLVGKGRLKIPNEWKTEMQSETGLYEPRRYMQSMAVRCAHATNAAHARWDYLHPAPFDLADNPSPITHA
ncbi:hypothetical protein A0H81_00052 [Grifola frondosa]|uniref:Uncharacterized protein n=1 Tax=Grifola frondosa TaxID=5627 RepID=A0A1C7MRM5_GRIFR|nr:hypothetical protein A0H81_00052 [Grifola frondosa]